MHKIWWVTQLSTYSKFCKISRADQCTSAAVYRASYSSGSTLAAHTSVISMLRTLATGAEVEAEAGAGAGAGVAADGARRKVKLDGSAVVVVVVVVVAAAAAVMAPEAKPGGACQFKVGGRARKVVDVSVHTQVADSSTSRQIIWKISRQLIFKQLNNTNKKFISIITLYTSDPLAQYIINM